MKFYCRVYIFQGISERIEDRFAEADSRRQKIKARKRF
jgi:hypothetical protein